MKRSLLLCTNILTVAMLSGCLHAKVNKLEKKVRSTQQLEQRLQKAESRITFLEVITSTLAQASADNETDTDSHDNNESRRRRGLDPDKRYIVPVVDHPTLGSAKALVTIVKVYEFACGYCFHANKTIEALRKRYGNKVRIVYRNFIVHEEARLPAYAVCAAEKQNKFEKMYRSIWNKGFQNEDLSEKRILAIAREEKLNTKRFLADLHGAECKQRVEADQKFFFLLGVQGTPTFFINGKPFVGSRPEADFRQIIDRELEEAQKTIDLGVVPEKYYDWLQKTILPKE